MQLPKANGSVGADLRDLEQDRAIKTDPDETKRRRTIRLVRNRGQSWGFTLQVSLVYIFGILTLHAIFILSAVIAHSLFTECCHDILFYIFCYHDTQSLHVVLL